MTEIGKMEVSMEGINFKSNLDGLKCLHWGGLNILRRRK